MTLTELRITKKAWDYALICVKGDIVPEAKMHLLAANIQDILDMEVAPLKSDIARLKAQLAADAAWEAFGG